MTDDIDIQKLQKELLSKIEIEFKKILYSELSLMSLVRQFESKPIEFQQDMAFYMGRYWFSMPYPKNAVIGIMNITS